MNMPVYVERCRIFREVFNWFDFVVVFTGFFSTYVEIAQATMSNARFAAAIPLGPLRTLRCIRLLRLVKAFVLVNHFKDLRRLIQGISTCVRILFWALFLVFIFMTIWGTLAVELLHPLMEDVAAGTISWENCPRCERSFQSVMDANLTFFQAIIGGDSWGLVAIPVIEKHPWAATIFVGSLFSIQVGLMNLIVAVLVDTSAEARLKDTGSRHADALLEEQAEKKHLARLFNMIDTDGNGLLSLAELEQGASAIEEFNQMLRVMDIKGADLKQLFLMLDEDGSGEIDPDEFIDSFYRLKCGDNHTAATFVKHYVHHLKKNQTSLLERMNSLEKCIKRELRKDRAAYKEMHFKKESIHSATAMDSGGESASEPASPTLSQTPGWPPNSNLADLVIYGVFIKQSTFCHINGHPKQYILVDTIFNYRFHFGLPGKCLY